MPYPKAGEWQPFRLDGYELEGLPQKQGHGRLIVRDGWTYLTVWDRTVDKRGGCNSGFLAKGELDLAEMQRFANLHFPGVLKRIGIMAIDYPAKALAPASAGQGRDGEEG